MSTPAFSSELSRALYFRSRANWCLRMHRLTADPDLQEWRREHLESARRWIRRAKETRKRSLT